MLQYLLFSFQFILLNSHFFSNIEKSVISKNNRIKNISLKNKNSIYLKKNLLIGAIKNYIWKNVSLFFKSFKHSRFKNCDCIIFVDNISQKTINKIKSYGAIVYPVPKKFKKKKLINYRWKLYEDFLNSNPDKYNLVFTSDLRDAFFQRDVFKLYNLKKPFLGIAIEDGTLSERTNKRWIIKSYGKKIYKTIKNKRIFCVGTVWGTAKKFCEFSNIMWKILDSEWSLIHHVIEQAIGNYIIYHKKLFNDCLVKSENKDGYVMTIGLTKRENIILDSKNNILNGKGEIAAVIHQYDRKHYIVKKLIHKFNLINHNERKEIISYVFAFIISIIIFLYKIKKKGKLYNLKQNIYI